MLREPCTPFVAEDFRQSMSRFKVCVAPGATA
jgi:hypothetical protein